MSDSGSELIGAEFDPEFLQARWVLGGLSAEDLAAQAIVALERGFAGIALQQLAGLRRPTLADLGTLPERAFSEMGLKPVNREQAVTLLISRGKGVTNGTVCSILEAFPAFSERWREHVEWWGGKPAGSYNDMAEFVHFVVEDLYDKNNLDEVRRVFQLMERLLSGGTEDTRNLIGLGFFETLQNVASWRSYGNQAFEQFLGPTSEQTWKEIRRMWAGKSSLAHVIRAERPPCGIDT